MTEQHDLARFVEAQDAQGTYQQALAELRQGNKTTHWIWFVFPQIHGLGSSPTAVKYAVQSLAEAREYLAHPILGPRLLECARTLLGLPGADAEAVLGGIDARKLQSSMTLFHRADPTEETFPAVLEKYYGGNEDHGTTTILAG